MNRAIVTWWLRAALDDAIITAVVFMMAMLVWPPVRQHPGDFIAGCLFGCLMVDAVQWWWRFVVRKDGV